MTIDVCAFFFYFSEHVFLLFQIKRYFPWILSTLLQHDRCHKLGVERYRVEINIPKSEKTFKRQKGKTRTVSLDRKLDASIVKVEERSGLILKSCSDRGRYTSHGWIKTSLWLFTQAKWSVVIKSIFFSRYFPDISAMESCIFF